MNTKIRIKLLLLTGVLFIGTFRLSAQEAKPENVKTGWTFGALPAISYNSDLGFQYGGLVNLYYFGDGSTYPKYKHVAYAEISRYTKGSGINRAYYDSEYLIPGLRVSADLSYYTDRALDFYGFNGYDAVYNPEWEDEASPDYKSRLFYRHDRNMLRFATDIQGSIREKTLRWVAGATLLKVDVGSLDLERLNKNQDEADKLPDVPSLYDNYVNWGIIPAADKDGGWANHLKAGLVYDTRDFEPNPMKGMWSELVVMAAPGFLGNGETNFTKLSATHRQYFTLAKDVLSLAYRLNMQSRLSGEIPFYLYPYMLSSFTITSTTDGLGGAKTVRGMLRNRVVGDAVAFGNAELRWKFLRTVLFKQNLYLGLNAFVDAGQVIRKVDLPTTGNLPVSQYFNEGEEKIHLTTGAGFRIVLNENFIVALDYGIPFDKRDGKSGMYIGLNYLF